MHFVAYTYLTFTALSIQGGETFPLFRGHIFPLGHPITQADMGFAIIDKTCIETANSIARYAW